MAITVTCSGCEKVYKLNDALKGKKIRCTSCQQVIVVGGASRAAGGPPKKRPKVDEESATVAPKSKPKRPVDKRNERPNAGLPLPWILGGVAGLVVLVGLGVGGYFLFRSPPSTPLVVKVTDLGAVPPPSPPDVPKAIDKPNPPSPKQPAKPPSETPKVEAKKEIDKAPAPKPTNPPETPKTKSELDGYWHLVNVERSGVGRPPNMPLREEEAVYIAGDKFHQSLKNGKVGNVGPWTIKIDDRVTPKTIDFRIGPSTYLGIYKLEGGQLTLATQFSTETRPDSFSVKSAGPGQPVEIHVYKLVAEDAEDAAAKALPKLDVKSQVLDGLWAVEEIEENALRIGGGYPDSWEEAVYFENDTWTAAKKDGWREMKAPVACKSNPSASPPTIDVSHDKGTIQCIYAVEGDRLTIASNGIGVERPRFFSTKLTAGPGRAGYLRRYRRVRPTEEITWLKQTGKLDPAKQVLDGLWIKVQHKNNVPLGSKVARLDVYDAVYFEQGKWHTATKQGKLLPNEARYEYRVDSSGPMPTLEMKTYGGERLKAVYKIEGDVLYFATNQNDELPKYFTTNLIAGPGRARCVVVFKRDGKPDATPVLDDSSPMPIVPKSELNGLWILDKTEDDLPPNERGWHLQEETIFIENGGYRRLSKDGVRPLPGPGVSITSDATTSPKRLDLKWEQNVWRSIYKIEGDVLTIATNFRPFVRPTAFSTKPQTDPGRPYHVRSYRRVKDPDVAKPAASLDSKTQVLAGPWTLLDEEGDFNGKWDWPRDAIVFENEEAHFERGYNRIGRLKIQTNPKATPPTIDMTFDDRTVRGIYKIDGDRLTIAVVRGDGPRPKLFTSRLAAGDGRAQYVRVYTRRGPSADSLKAKEMAKGGVKLDPARQKIDGTWIVERQDGLLNQHRRPKDFGEAISFQNGKWQLATNGGMLIQNPGTYVCDPNAAIPTIDFKNDRNEVCRGIYIVDGDTLYFASNFESIVERPRLITADPAAGPGHARFSAVLKRGPNPPGAAPSPSPPIVPKAIDKPTPPGAGEVKSELDGYWQFVSQQNDWPKGVRGWDVRTDDGIYVERGQRVGVTRTGVFAHGSRPVTIAVDASKSPKTLDFKSGNNQWLAIYKIENGVLTVATQFSTETRPSAFTTSQDAGPGRAYHVQVYKQVKESAAEAAAKVAGPLDRKSQDLAGLWALEETLSQRERGILDLLRGQEAIYFEGGRGLFARKDGWSGSDPFTFKFDPNATPPTLDAKFGDRSFQAIYKIVGDELVVASNDFGAERPLWFSTSLTTSPGRASELRRFRRVHPTERIVQLTQTPKLDPQKQQSLDGFWLVEYDKGSTPDWPVAEAYLVEGRKWSPATRHGTVVREPGPFVITAIQDPTKPTPMIDSRGIYKVEGDRLYVAMNLVNRPKSFTTNLTGGAGYAQRVLLLRRGEPRSDATNARCEPLPAPDPFPADLISPKPRPTLGPESLRAHDELNGYWKLEKRDTHGNDDWKANWEQAIYVEGQKYHFVGEHGLVAGNEPFVIKVDPTTIPKTILYRFRDESWRGIYKIEGDKLIVATNFLPQRWPSDFSTKLGAKDNPSLFQQVRTYSRVAETPDGLRQKTIPALDAANQRLEGFWILKDQQSNPTRDVGGYPVHWDEAMHFEGDWLQYPHKNGSLRHGKRPVPFRCDPKAVPPTIDVPIDGRQWRGIYKIEGDQLTIAFGGPDVDRPRWFTTKLTAGPGRANFLRTYVRARPSAEVTLLTSKVKLDPAKQKLDGLWIVERQSGNGHAALGFDLGEATYFENGTCKAALKSGRFALHGYQAKYVSDPSADVPKVDFTVGTTEIRGIFKVDGDLLYLAVNPANAPRPCFFTSDLTAGPGRAAFAAVLKRASPADGK